MRRNMERAQNYPFAAKNRLISGEGLADVSLDMGLVNPGRPFAPGGSANGAGTGPSMVTAGAQGCRHRWQAGTAQPRGQAGTRVICRWLAKLSITLPKKGGPSPPCLAAR